MVLKALKTFQNISLNLKFTFGTLFSSNSFQFNLFYSIHTFRLLYSLLYIESICHIIYPNRLNRTTHWGGGKVKGPEENLRVF